MAARCLRRRSLPAVAAILVVATASADAQEARYPVLPAQLPRPGYEPRTLHLGAATLALQLDAATQYDTNVFATSRNADDDVILQLSPRVELDASHERWRLHGEGFATIREYVSNSGESRAGFGVAGSARFLADRRHDFDGGFRIERIVQSRNDPEASERRNLPPRGIDAYQGNLGFGVRLGRLGFDGRGEVQRLDYRPQDDADRSLTSYRGVARGSYQVSGRLTGFGEVYVNRRDNDRAVDRNGVDRDATTVGATAGVRLSLTGRLTGEAGVGRFRSNPDAPELRSFSGLAANANLTWSPVPRTAIIANVFRGDVATVRSGAIGRIDTRASLRLSQEARHNLLFDFDAAYRTTQFRGTSDTQRTLSFGFRGERLLNRLLGVFVEVEYARRRADDPTERFDRGVIGVGVRLRH